MADLILPADKYIVLSIDELYYYLPGFTIWPIIRVAALSRDGWKCTNCNLKYNANNKDNLHVHHIDHDKFNNGIDNLITLCISCHSKRHIDEDKSASSQTLSQPF